MKLTIASLNLWILPTVVSSAFVITTYQQSNKHPVLDRSVVTQDIATTTTTVGKTALFSSAASSEIERLLAKARALREQAQRDEHHVHVSLAEKQATEHAKTDQLIDYLFFNPSGGSLVDRLHMKKLCIDTLEKIVDRLDEREAIAEGKEQVHLVLKDGIAGFERASCQNEVELARIQGKIDELIDGVSILDEEFRQEKELKGEIYTAHTEDQHWGSGRRAERLTNRVQEIRREREEHFQNRMQEIYDAQKIKKGRPPPPKVHDDHGLVP